MANLYFHNPQTNERALKKMLFQLSIGASGAVTIARGINVISAAKSATGEITIVMPPFNKFVGANFALLWASAIDDSYQVKSVNASTGVIVIFTKTGGVAADLPSGSVLLMELMYKNTVVSN
jgi:hypothetical protein